MQDLIILSKDTVVAKYIENKFEIVCPNLIPLYLKRTENLEKWLEERAIDSHRTNSRLLKRMLRLQEKDDVNTVLAVHAATITDTYWAKSPGSKLTYDEVRFKANDFAEVALNGDSSGFNLPFQHTPELTNIGSYEKCWKMKDNHWYMYKKEPLESLFSEIYISKLGKLLGCNMVDYNRYKQNIICCKDFTNSASINFEDAQGLIPENKEIDFLYNFKTFYDINPKIAKDYADMLYLDAVCMNVDRHIHNYGILRDIETGEILQLAPNFDNNISLMFNGNRSEPVRGFMTDYTEFFKSVKDIYTPPIISQEIVTQASLETEKQFSVKEIDELSQKMNVAEFIINSQKYIEQNIRLDTTYNADEDIDI